jgi:hypothetical protein
VGNYYLVIKTIKGNRYYYWQKTYREGRHVRTLNKYIGPVVKVPRPISPGPIAVIPKKINLASCRPGMAGHAAEWGEHYFKTKNKLALSSINTQCEIAPAEKKKLPPLDRARAQIPKLGGYSRIDTMPLVQQNAYAADELASSFSLNAEYWYKYATENNIPLLPYLRRIEAEEVIENRFAILNEALDAVSGCRTPKPFSYAPIQPSTGLSPEDAAIEKKAVAKLQADRKGMLNEYVRTFGKVVNADLARRMFADVGYNGRNSAAVHEPSSALAKDAWRHNLKNNPQPDAVLYAGMSGAGKSSAVTGVLPHVEDDAAAVLDGNLSKITTAEERIKEALDAGKDPIIVYVWRDPVDAWVNGVVKRMKTNAQEGGRVVPMSEALKNGPGSLATVRAALDKGAAYNEDVYIVDNSLGAGNAKLMDRAKFDQLSYPTDLRATLTEKTKGLYDAGQITAEQYEALIA